MTKLKKPVDIETAFNTYHVTDMLGEGGSGRVYGGVDSSGIAVAVKVLTSDASDKRRRFKNEAFFLMRNKHQNIVTVTDHGIANAANVRGPFYVMPRYERSLRDLIGSGLTPEQVMQMFSQVLDGVEAAHLFKVTHRDLKPENILIGNSGKLAVVADFGVAGFTDELLLTLVKTPDTKRLANFQYAAPEQRKAGQTVDATADIYALGLMLNELFTTTVPHGTDFRQIGNVSPKFGFLDAIVAEMIRQNPANRPASIADVKQLIQKHEVEAVSLQKLSELKQVVIPVGEVDDPLAHEPPKLIGAEYRNGALHLTLDRPVNSNWITALHNMGSYSSVMGIPPTAFRFNGADVVVGTRDTNAQAIINHFKDWLPKATGVLKYHLEQEAARVERQRNEQLVMQLELERRNLEINRKLKI